MTDPEGRIEELERTVRELEATVQGLTEELVEANDRIRKLEERGRDAGQGADAFGADGHDAAATPGDRRSDGTGQGEKVAPDGPENSVEASGEAQRNKGTEAQDRSEETGEPGDDIIIA